MNKLDYFTLAIKSEQWRRRVWRIAIFTVTRLNTETFEEFDLDYRKEGTFYYDGKEWVELTDAIPMQSLFGHRELAKFPADILPIVKEPLVTTYGRILFNSMVVCYAFGEKLPFFHKGRPKDLVNIFINRVVDEDQPDLPEVQGKFSGTIRPSELSRFVEGLFELTSMCSYVTTTGGENSLTTDPRMVQLRNELFEKYKHDLTQTNVTKIQNELVDLDREWCKGTDAELFYIDDKAYTVKRKKLFAMHGIENAFEEGNEFTVIEKSLSEGWDMDELIPKYNAIREGSFNRGHDTALGGEKVTFLQRIYQNAKVLKGDCGTKRVDTVDLTISNYRGYLGLNIVDNGTLVELGSDNYMNYVGTICTIRRPILCESQLMDFCSACAGNALAKNPRSIASEVSTVGSNIMYAFMAAMHGIELAVAEYDINTHLD